MARGTGFGISQWGLAMHMFDHDQVTTLFAEARSLPAAERAAFLDAHCNDRPELRREVEELLACDNPARAVFDEACDQLVQPDPIHIGPYELLEPVGEGGMAIVYKAQQRSPVRRIVAIKLIKLGMDTRQFVARFESERQALAMMDHPNVAQVYDAGSTPTGRPYFAMEYVAGERILRWCDGHKLSIRQRLELFIPVCQAVEHAHRKGIIHRDLKDSNVLVAEVDGRAVPKVIDFGVAKTINQPLTDRTMFTEQGQLIGTPAYMSPEQAERGALHVDTRADVYSLGVLLYELLAGVEPISSESLQSGSYEEVRRLICETDPPKPGTRLSTLTEAQATAVAELRGVRSAALVRQLHDELEWIPLKAMRKDREQRYRSAAELADDIQNYLSGHPLIAGPESRSYLLRKFLRRHRASVATAVIIALLLIAGIVATSLQTIRARRAEQAAMKQQQRAEQARAATEQVNKFLVEMLESASPRIAKGKQVLVQDVVDAAAQKLPTAFPNDPLIESPIRSALGRTYLALGLYEQAEAQIGRSRELDARELGSDDPQSLMSAQLFGLVRRNRGQYEETRAIYEDTLARRRRVLGPNHIDTLNSLSDVAVILDLLGSPDAEARYREARDQMITTLGRDHAATLRVTGNLGQLLQRVGKFEESERLLRESYEGRKRTLGADDPETVNISSALAYVMRRTGKMDQAVPLMREALENSRRINGENHPKTIFTENGLAQLLCESGNTEDGLRRYLHAVDQARQYLGTQDPNTFAIMQAAATEMANASRPNDAEPLFKEAIDGLRKLRGPDHILTLSAEMNYCSLLQVQGRWDESLPLAKHGFELLREPGRMQIAPARRAKYLTSYGMALSRLKRNDEAIEPLTVAREALRAQPDVNPLLVQRVLECLIASCNALDRKQDSARWTDELRSATTQPATKPATRPTTIPTT